MATKTEIAGDWSLVVTDAGACGKPSELPEKARALAAPVPGTVAEALERAGRFDRTNPIALNDRDFWYLAAISGERPGPVRLVFEGLATIAEVYFNDECVLKSANQFAAQEVAVTLTGEDRLAICFRALNPQLKAQGPRARWRPQMITPPGLRLIRTTLLGHMPGWCPSIDVVGPYRPITMVREDEGNLDNLEIRAWLDAEGKGVLDVSFGFSGRASDLRLSCAGWTAPVLISEEGRLTARVTIPNVKPWWPRSHGEPTLYPVTLIIDDVPHPLGVTGFRNIAFDPGQDGKGFGIEINGVPIFCRGAVWTNADIVRMPGGRADYERHLRLAADAGINMIRVGGTMTYESAEFFRLCDELGIMVWQDFMFANFDYPVADPAFVEEVRKEARWLLTQSQGSPSLTVLCGGSEMYQQASMLGLPQKYWAGPLTEEILPQESESLRPDVIYVPNSPFGGALPFYPNEGIGHYYGVGAYCRPLEDARRANLRFAAECLAFAHVPEQATLDAHLAVPPVHDPKWKARVPRDRGASWDFEDIRDHYLGDLYGFDPARLRREDPGRYLEFSRAVTGEVVEAAFSEWRRPGSSCRGALVWTLQDLLPGAGWGIIDATGMPKPVWHGLRRAFRPVQVLLSDEGTNGLDVHVLNESEQTRSLTLQLSCLKGGIQPSVSGSRTIELAPRSSLTLTAIELFGAFFDVTYAFRFGPPSHDVTVARLVDAATEEELSTAYHFPRGRMAAMQEAVIETELLKDDDGWMLKLTANRFAQSLSLNFEGYLPSDNWFHLAPGPAKIIRLVPEGANPEVTPTGTLGQLGSRVLQSI
ncbi:glycoside hydrolase family 2 protein [Rhizobium alvei]|uniref:beta-mannosidase n=1 Tax=Rhizobium alvei TaxID=1132659 RepID=A0ABT8YFA9_9HYPH|nr:glycoside hydrolase family 2 protein [Rhizobium alvei]MDO6962401.1 glycoside hydrolase family 2 protein [Rhizobium alvei]